MPLFDDISRKLTQAGQSIEQKTKDVASLTKISSALSGEEKNRDRIYIQIGKLYYEQYADSAQGEFSGLVAAAKQTEQRIVELRKQVQEIKGVRSCEQCGAEVPIDAAFCNHCGAQMPKPQIPEDAVVCQNCGAILPNGVKFCTSCGSPMQVAAPEIPTQEPVPPQLPTCPQCGALCVEGTAFCTECGASIATVQFEDVISYHEPVTLVEETPVTRLLVCPRCGSPLVDGAVFCTECGQRV